MSFLDVYIGNDDGFSFECTDEQYRICHIPKRIGPFFPNGNVAFLKLKDKIEAGELEGDQVDWGAWAAHVNKAQILSFIGELYADEYPMDDKKFDLARNDACPTEYKRIKKFVDTMSCNKKYILVASEF